MSENGGEKPLVPSDKPRKKEKPAGKLADNVQAGQKKTEGFIPEADQGLWEHD